MRKMMTLTLPVTVVSEILNHLRDGVEVWRDTAEYIANGNFVAPCVVADCTSVKKARSMMKLYEEAISVIEKAVGSR